MTFRFPWQHLLHLKENQASQAKWQLQSALHHLSDQEKMLGELHQDRNRLREDLSELEDRGSTVGQMMLMEQYLQRIDRSIHRQQNEVRTAEGAVDQRRSEVTDAEREEKIWHKVKEKRFRQYRVEYQRIEQKEADEMANQRHFRRS
jgi:flagellar FliJ protein